MIVRIHMDDQYRLSDEAVAEVDRLDEKFLHAITSDDATSYSATLDELLAYVRAHGEKVPLEEIVSSDLILPSEDVSMEEARAILEKSAEQSAPASEPTSETAPEA